MKAVKARPAWLTPAVLRHLKRVEYDFHKGVLGRAVRYPKGRPEAHPQGSEWRQPIPEPSEPQLKQHVCAMASSAGPAMLTVNSAA